MNITVEGTGAGSLPVATISNVENFFIRDVAGAGSTYNFGIIQGEEQVWSNTSTNTVTFQNLGTGTTVGLKGNGVLNNLGNLNFNMTTATDAVSIAIDGGVRNTVAPTITATAGTATSATIASTGAANTVGAVTLSGGTNTVQNLTVNAATNLTAGLVATDFATAGAVLVVSGAASSVNLGGNGVFKTIDASGLTAGGVTVGLSNVTTSFKGGAGNDSVTGTAIAAGAVIDGGSGIDTVQTTLINAGNAASFKNFEILNVTGQTAINLDANLLTGSTITGAQIAGVYTTGASLSNLSVDADGFDLLVSGSTAAANDALTLGFKNITGTEDKVNVVFSAQAAGTNTNAGVVTLQGIEQVTIASGGTAKTGAFVNQITLTDNALQTVTITGSNATSLQVTDQDLVGTATLSALTTIDASAATGRFTFVELADATSKGLTIKGSAGVDNITVLTHALSGGTYGADTITLGAGADVVNVGGATLQVVSNAAAVTTITDAATGDILDFSAALAAQANFVSTAVSTAGATDLRTALDAIANGAGGVGNAAWGTYGGDTYIVFDAAVAGLTVADQVVKLVGVHNLATSTVAGGDLVLAM
ncbi:beta strand repeat-containing protein [Parapusillimonas granuli]|uniref:S-layer protein n=1 Tax=Parapusillimonas granuli TaxID=380911 RepID=A0A853G6L7_9BURK|nr:hypothetical protein [Parapusillimonas granuli]MBB5217638.1 hypothetical protein [Parapusillimonas granuli]NYT51939.1 hypothetical protein [Parapusillimonas granuli]